MEWRTIFTMLIGLGAGWLFSEASSFLASRREKQKILKEGFYTLLKIEMIASSLHSVIKDYKSINEPDDFEQFLVSSFGEEYVDDFKNIKESLIEVIRSISKIDPFLSFELQSFSYLEDIGSMAITLVQNKDYKGTNPIEFFSPLRLKKFISKLAFKISIWFWLRYYFYNFKQKKHKQISLIKI